MSRAAILGGGIAGLATAWELRKRFPTVEAKVFEASGHFGGKITSRTMDGCLLEGGPDSLLTEKPWGIQLCRELGLADALLPSNDEQRSFSILHQGNLHPFPAGCKLFVPQKITPILTTRLLSIKGKLRMLAEPWLRSPPPDTDESLADFTRRHFGQEALDRLAGPLLGGIYGGDPEDMSMAATFPRLREMEAKHGSLTRGMAAMMREAKARQRTGSPPALFTSLRGGMQQLPDALRERLADCLLPDTPVRELAKEDGHWRVNGEIFDHVFVCLPARDAAPLFAKAAPDLCKLLSLQQSSSSATLSMVFDRKEMAVSPKGFGFMSAHPLPSLLVGCTWTGNKFKHREAKDRFLCRAFLGGAAHQDAIRDQDEAQIVQQALDALREVCPFVPPAPRATWLQRWPHGNPGYAVGHPKWLENLRSHAKSLGNLQFIGSGYDGVSVSDCARQAQNLSLETL